MVVAGPKSLYKDGEMGQKFVDPNPGSSVEEKPFRTSTLVMAGPKILYGDGETGQKFVMPNPGLNNEALV